MEIQTLSSIGVISKRENLASVEHETHSSALVLESLHPFPGYHGTTVPDRTDPKSLFLVTKNIYGDDRIIRSIKQVKKNFPHFFDGAPGLINLYNKPTGVIRLKYLPYNLVGELISAFQEMGLEFIKHRKVNNYGSIIKITKYLILEEVSEGIWHDKNWKELYYLSLPVQLRWNSFEKITTSIKHNVEDNNFDAALTNVYDKDGVLDLVRIYDEQSCLGKLIFIHEKYLEAIKYL